MHYKGTQIPDTDIFKLMGCSCFLITLAPKSEFIQLSIHCYFRKQMAVSIRHGSRIIYTLYSYSTYANIRNRELVKMQRKMSMC